MAINFLAGLNAVQKIYQEKTGLMVPVGVDGENPEPTPTEFTITNVTVYDNGGGAFSVAATVINPNDNYDEIDLTLYHPNSEDKWFSAVLIADNEQYTHYSGNDNDDIEGETPECGTNIASYSGGVYSNGSEQFEVSGRYDLNC